ncbi:MULTISPECIES: hypothetical protein [unclassified Rhizobium]|uniref:hypothetical protein n=1 Tax=unclassified Rhizobium TaxID=2613769 RepID=UPI0021F7261F|nr:MULTISPECIES: hypothetical protein [unclassified Rhizobium]MCV9946101.1 hypothetical protein [Rhizobium sp. BT-175]MCW0019947.1 hypothetical protein [Rhizobium sp. BT-226]
MAIPLMDALESWHSFPRWQKPPGGNGAAGNVYKVRKNPNQRSAFNDSPRTGFYAQENANDPDAGCEGHGLSLQEYQKLEDGESNIREVYRLAWERLSPHRRPSIEMFR